MTESARPIPFVIVTGFLGSGKTTLIRRLLADEARSANAVIVNELGEVGIDEGLVREVSDRVSLVAGGCACCRRRDDVVGELRALLDIDDQEDGGSLRRVILETSGLADPAPIPFSILSDPVLRHHFRLDRVIATADACLVRTQLARHSESLRQLVSADEIVLTKTDLPDSEDPATLRALLETINPTASLYASGERGIHSAPRRVASLSAPGAMREPGSHGDLSRIDSYSLTFDRPVDWTAFGVWLSALLHAYGEAVLRFKALIDTGDTGPVSLNAVQHVVHPPQHLVSWGRAQRRSRMVFVTEDLPAALVASSLECFLGVASVVSRRSSASGWDGPFPV